MNISVRHQYSTTEEISPHTFLLQVTASYNKNNRIGQGIWSLYLSSSRNLTAQYPILGLNVRGLPTQNLTRANILRLLINFE